MSFRSNKLLLSLFSAVLLTLSWYLHLSFILFFAFVPLLILEDELSKSLDPKRKAKVFRFSYLTFVLWNFGATWWIILVQFGKFGAVLAWLANALLMAFVFLTFSNLKNRINKSWAIWLLVPIWIAWEYLHSLWDLAWIWLNLANSFAFNHNWVQWFEFTGSSGGALWVLVVNILVFKAMKDQPALKFNSKPIWRIAAAIIVPILVSYIIILVRTPLSQQKEKMHVVVVQPNLDPYNDKFVEDFQPTFSKGLRLAKQKITDKTQYLVLPETFITELRSSINEEDLANMLHLQWFRDSLIKPFPNLKVVVGASSYLPYRKPEDVTATARLDKGSGIRYDEFNTAFQIDKYKIQVYHKSKLVPAVERMPFPALLKPLESLALDMGGTTGSLGTQKDRVSFTDGATTGVAPVICYESVFSDFTTEYIRKGASFIFIITNDGWWGDSPGFVHHLNYARLRAIENRRQIARSANTGVSCFIDEFGNISEATKYWEDAVIEKNMVPNNDLTFFSRFGDLISYFSVLITLLLLAFAWYQRFSKKFLNKG
jgi:apolipoprotein N-acyltransferase